MSDISIDELKTLENLSINSEQKSKLNKAKISDTEDLETSLDDLFRQPNRTISQLTIELKNLRSENELQRLWITVLAVIVMLVLSTALWLILRKRKIETQ